MPTTNMTTNMIVETEGPFFRLALCLLFCLLFYLLLLFHQIPLNIPLYGQCRKKAFRDDVLH